MTPTGRFSVGRKIVPLDRCPAWEGTVLRLIPLDVWAAVATIGYLTLSRTPIISIAIYLGLCAFIVVQTMGDEPDR